MADCFMRGMLRELFCTDLTFTPEATFAGKIIILNLPVKEYSEPGQFAHMLQIHLAARSKAFPFPLGLRVGRGSISFRQIPVLIFLATCNSRMGREWWGLAGRKFTMPQAPAQ
jgi:hypothetical protein